MMDPISCKRSMELKPAITVGDCSSAIAAGDCSPSLFHIQVFSRGCQAPICCHNVCCGLVVQDIPKPLARWALLSPAILDGAEEAMVRKHAWPAGWLWGESAVGAPARKILSLGDILQLQSEFGDDVVHFEQSAGQMIHILAGWVHSVETLQPCIKYAFEVVKLAELPVYLKYWAQFGTRFSLALPHAGDYSGVQRSMQDAFEAHQ